MKRNFDDPVYTEWRKKVFKRDNFTCQMPGCKNKKMLEAHHIEKWSTASALRFEVSNGITLCRKHHNEVNKKETYYKTLFNEIIRSNERIRKSP